jgi:hypothetical protein
LCSQGVDSPCHRSSGFVIGALTLPPPVSHPGGPVCMVDDFAVAAPEAWHAAGAALLRAITQEAQGGGQSSWWSFVRSVTMPNAPSCRRLVVLWSRSGMCGRCRGHRHGREWPRRSVRAGSTSNYRVQATAYSLRFASAFSRA